MTFFSEKLGQQGPHLFIFHGWGRSGADLKPLAEMMSATHQVHLFDLPGFGQSPYPGADWSAEDYAKAILAYAQKNAIDSFSVMGHSFGGKVAISLALLVPAKVHKMVLIASAGLKNHHPFYKRLRAKAIGFLGKTIKQWDKITGKTVFSTWFSPRYGSANYRDAGKMRNILVKSVNEDYTSRLKEIKTPALLLWGEWDTETYPEAGLRMAKLIPQSQLILFPQKDHYLPCGVGGHLVGRYAQPFLVKEGT